jgi:hypothetical protein
MMEGYVKDTDRHRPTHPVGGLAARDGHAATGRSSKDAPRISLGWSALLAVAVARHIKEHH